jgi:hypothetical protein
LGLFHRSKGSPLFHVSFFIEQGGGKWAAPEMNRPLDQSHDWRDEDRRCWTTEQA